MQEAATVKRNSPKMTVTYCVGDSIGARPRKSLPGVLTCRAFAASHTQVMPLCPWYYLENGGGHFAWLGVPMHLERLVNATLRFVPSRLATPTHATESRPAMRAYSTPLAPRSSLRK